MADGTAIEWTDATVNAVNGCSVVSPGCKHCYAMKQAHRVEARRGLTQHTAGGMVWTGEVRLNEKALVQPLAWSRSRRIFWNAHGDLFHEKVPDAWIDRVFAACALTPHHQHQILTKRPARMRAYMQSAEARIVTAAMELAPIGRDVSSAGMIFQAGRGFGFEHWPLPNVWLGTSIEDRARLLERAGDLIATPAAVHFWSAEPLLGDLGHIDHVLLPDWVIVGGESGPRARPMHPDWARALRNQCAAAGVPYFFKQWGVWAPSDLCQLDCKADALVFDRTAQTWREATDGGWIGDQAMCRVGKAAAGRLLDGVEHSAMPIINGAAA